MLASFVRQDVWTTACDGGTWKMFLHKLVAATHVCSPHALAQIASVLLYRQLTVALLTFLFTKVHLHCSSVTPLWSASLLLVSAAHTH